MNQEYALMNTVFTAWNPENGREYDNGPCGLCNYFGNIGEYKGYETYQCAHGNWFLVKEVDLSGMPLYKDDPFHLRMLAAGPNNVWGDIAWEDEQEALANETPQEKLARLAAQAEADRESLKRRVGYKVNQKEEKWTKNGEMKFRVPRPCKYATLFQQRICAGCNNKVPIGQTHCQSKQGHLVCGQELAGCWNHEQHKTCIYIHPDEPQWADACSGKLNYDRQSQTFFLQGQAVAQVNRFQAAARQDSHRPSPAQAIHDSQGVSYTPSSGARPPRHNGNVQQRSYQPWSNRN
jgi:hypothetical protein